MAVIQKEFISSDVIDAQVLSNSTFLKSRNNADSGDVNMFKVNTSDKIEAGADLNMGSFNIITSGNVDGVDVSAKGTNVSNLVTLSGVAADSVNLGEFSGSSIPDNQTIKQALQALETKVENVEATVIGFEWQESAKDYITDNTLAPPTEVSGERYVLSAAGGSPHADWDGASAGDVVEFNGTVWTKISPTLGTFIAVDDDTSGVYYWGGAAWAFKNFEATTASTGCFKSGFDIQLANASLANGIQVASGAIKVVPDDATIEINGANKVAVKSGVFAAAGHDHSGVYEPANSNIQTHISSTSNPHSVTKSQVGLSSVDNVQQLPMSYLDTDNTLASDSDAKVPSQKAIKFYVDNKVGAALDPELEIITLIADDITNGYVDLGFTAMAGSVSVTPVGGPLQQYGVDYTLSVVSSKTRITFAGDLAAILIAGHKLMVSYLKG